MKYTILISLVLILFLAACNSKSPTNNQVTTSDAPDSAESGITFPEPTQDNVVARQPRFDAGENQIIVNWYAVERAVNYEIFWANERSIEASYLTSSTQYTIPTAGFQSFSVWIVAFDDEGNVLQTTEAIQVSSLNPILLENNFSDAAPTD